MCVAESGIPAIRTSDHPEAFEACVGERFREVGYEVQVTLERTGFHYAYSIYQVEYSRNLLFGRGSQMDQVFQRMVDRTRAQLDVRQVRTLFGMTRRPKWRWKRRPRLEVFLETSVYDLTVFKLHFGKLTLKAYTKGEHVLRFESSSTTPRT